MHCTGDRVGTNSGLDGCRKFHPPPGLDSWTVLPLASRYTDCGILAYALRLHNMFNYSNYLTVDDTDFVVK